MSFLSGRILVTGGAGFIGSALIWALNRRGVSDIVVADLLGSDEKWRNLVPLRFAEYLEGTSLRTRLAANPEALGRFSAVFHLGACSATTERNAAYLADNNTAFTRELAAWALAQGARFVYASSAATYGDGAQGMDDASPDLSRLRPLNMYGYSKHLFDLYAQRAGWLDRIVGVKYFNVFGPNEEHKGDMRSLVSKAYGQIQATGKLQLFKSHPPGLPGRRADAGLPLREGRGRDDPALRRAGPSSRRPLQPRLRPGPDLAGPRRGHLRRDAAARPPSNSWTCPRPCRASTSTTPRPTSAKLRGSGYDRPLTPLRTAVADYVQNYLMTGRQLGGG